MPENERSDTAEFCKKSRISLTVGSLFYLLAFVLLYYKYVPQIEFDPYEEKIREVLD